MEGERESSGECVPSTCLRCRLPVFVWAGAAMADGSPVLFDLVGEGSERMLMVHDCCYDDGLDDPDPFDDPYDQP